VLDPFDGSLVAEAADLGREGAEAAAAAAAAAQPGWAARTAGERADVLRRWHALVVESADDLARLMTVEQGKPLAEARAEVLYGASFILWFAEEARRPVGEVIPANAPDRRIVALRQPIGPAACITPWNFPSAMAARKAAPALAAGCAVVLKPASETPLSALALAALAEEAGVPPGALNVVTGRRAAEIGDVLARDPRLPKLSFTGSTEVGRRLMRLAADRVKSLSLELGGNAPLLVFDDADLEAAVEGTVASKFRNSGQTCVCANRILVQDGIHDDFVEALGARVRAMRVGDGLEPGVDQGPLIGRRAVEKVEEHIADALARGARAAAEAPAPEDPGAGLLRPPVVLEGATPDMLAAREETFGPLAPVMRFRSEAEAVALANGTRHGLAAYAFTRDLARAWRVGEALEAGIVGVNTGVVSCEMAPFGGVKESGIGREGAREGLLAFTETKYLCVAGLGGSLPPAGAAPPGGAAPLSSGTNPS